MLVLNGGCSQKCTNSVGSYDCSCKKNYQLGGNGKSCFFGKLIIMNTTNIA